MSARLVALVVAGALGAAAHGLACAAELPARLAPPAPFPLVTRTARETEFVAPGVTRTAYRLATSSGPLRINVVAVDLHDAQIRAGAVLADDRLITKGETISAMAARTGAVAGINADYFDIGQTNQPLNLVVRDGTLERTPSTRATVTIRTDGTVRFGAYRFTGNARLGGAAVAVDVVNEWPPHGGAALLSPAFGTLPAGASVVPLAPVALGADGRSGTYRVAAAGPAPGAPLTGPVLAFPGPLPGELAPAALAAGAPVQITLTTDPSLDGAVTAVGGGPLLIADGRPVDDPAAPVPAEAPLRYPVGGIATEPDGTLLLIAVDGRLPELSVGLTRPELAALMLGLGARDGMAVDSGGSVTLVTRVLGEAQPRPLNHPSDGAERPVADGLFVYSTAPLGPPARLVVRPAQARALGGVGVPLRAVLTDRAGHLLGPAPGPWTGSAAPPGLARVEPSGILMTADAGSERGSVVVRRAGLSATIPVRIYRRVAGLSLDPPRPNPDPGGMVRFSARAVDADGDAVALGDRIAWSTTVGRIDPGGLFRAGPRDAVVTARAGGVAISVAVPVGRRWEPLALFDGPAAARWRFTAIPPGPGSVAPDPACRCLALAYDFGGAERGAYAAQDLTLPPATVGLGLDVRGDGAGAALRATLVAHDGRRARVTLAPRIDWTGWRRVEAAVPADLEPPVRLVSLYAVGTLGDARVRAAGTLAFRDGALLVAGTP